MDKYRAKGSYPVSFAIYIRMFKGTNGGLSTSSHQTSDEYIAAIDIVTNPKSSGYQLTPQERKQGKADKFKEEIQEYFMNPINHWHAKPHWGKALPSNGNYAELYGDNFKHFMNTAEKWYDNVGCAFVTSPFMNPFFEEIFSRARKPIREMKHMRMVETLEYSLATDEIERVTEEEVKQLQGYMLEIKYSLVENHYINPPQTAFYSGLITDENIQAAQPPLPYIGIYSRAGDDVGYANQQKEIQKKANEFFQELEKVTEDIEKDRIDTTA